jgi:translocation and assembly module TamB
MFALDGILFAERGTYRLNLGLALQRTFEVESGTLRFFGDPDLNPTLDIAALHTVRQANQSDRDVPIRVRIGGTLAQPTLTLSSADPNLQLSESDAISYLITGQPSFVIAGDNQQYSSQAAGVLLPSIGSYFGDKVANSLGLDVVQIETTGNAEGGASEFLGSTLANTRFGGGVQIGSRTFIRANLGLCPFAQQLGVRGVSGGASNRPLYSNVLTSIGAKLEYRLSNSYSASLGLDPPTEVLSCATRGAAPTNFVTTPQQFGLDFTRKWEF